MEAMEKLSAYMKNRVAELSKLKSQGRKIIGYTPGGYMPEELVYACGGFQQAFSAEGSTSRCCMPGPISLVG